MNTRSLSFLGLILCVLSVLSASGPSEAQAKDNDIVLSRLATFNQRACGLNGDNLCGDVSKNQAAFNKLAVDLGEVFAPRLANPAETLGEAGFAIGAMTSLSFIPNDEQYWKDVVEDRDPSSSLFTGHLQVRKGLPFSFEVAGNMGYLFNSEMFTVGADLKWALHEGFFYMPAVAVRGSVNTVLGSEYLNLTTAGWDVSLSKDFGINGVLSLAPFIGYQNLYIIGSSRLINAFPQDPRPPQTITWEQGGQEQSDTFSPEFVFEQHTESINRFFLGARLNVWILSFVLEGVLGNNVNQVTFSGGLDF